MKRSDDLAKMMPADLRKALPADAAFVDLLRYIRFEQDPKVKGRKGEKRTPHYVAFVVTRAAVTRVELGEAKPIEDALDLWRRAVVESSPTEPTLRRPSAHSPPLVPAARGICRPRRHPPSSSPPTPRSTACPGPPCATPSPGASSSRSTPSPWCRTGRCCSTGSPRANARPKAKPTLLAMGGVAYDKKTRTRRRSWRCAARSAMPGHVEGTGGHGEGTGRRSSS